MSGDKESKEGKQENGTCHGFIPARVSAQMKSWAYNLKQASRQEGYIQGVMGHHCPTQQAAATTPPQSNCCLATK